MIPIFTVLSSLLSSPLAGADRIKTDTGAVVTEDAAGVVKEVVVTVDVDKWVDADKKVDAVVVGKWVDAVVVGKWVVANGVVVTVGVDKKVDAVGVDKEVVVVTEVGVVDDVGRGGHVSTKSTRKNANLGIEQ
jgi:hypothetical protein